jgi:molecular chaperone DnaJ
VAAVKRDYYEVLGVAADADEKAIRRAFHGLARDWHPDVSELPDAERRFREIAEAYSVLSKPDARLLYDRCAYRGRGNTSYDAAFWDSVSGVVRGENIHIDIELPGFDAAAGTRRKVNFQAAVRCEACGGDGSIGAPDPECETCRGTGRRRRVADVEIARLLQIEACPACLSGPCPHCGGRGTVETQRRIRLHVPPGVEDGTHLRVRGDGNDGGAGSIPGDLFLRVRVPPPPKDPKIVRRVAFMMMLVAIAMLVLCVLGR